MEQHSGQNRWRWQVVLALLGILCVGFFLRSVHFSDWLHFELDQARDARVIDAAAEGSFFDLPLLGPKAGGTFLRLGPFFYVFQYVSGLVFGMDPVGYALGVMILSVAAVGAFFLLARRFFSDRLSFGLTALFSVSAYFVMYGRFAWNPNPLPFFILAGFYALLRSVDAHESRRGVWFGAGAALLGMASQLHFLAFITLPVLVASFLLIRRPKYSWKAWLSVFGIIGVLYLPVALNEIETQGQNSREFVMAITKKSTKEDHGLPEKFLRDVSEHGLANLVITTGFEGGTFPALRIENGTLTSLCLNRCDEGKWYGVVAVCVSVFSVLTLLFFWWRERERTKSDFLLLVLLWIGITFVVFLPLSYGVAPRFFLLSGPFFLFSFGTLLLSVERLIHRHHIGRIINSCVMVLLIGSNLFFLSGRFHELAQAGTDAVESAPDRILKERIRVTFAQQQAIVSFLEARSRATGYPVYMWSEPQHRRALKYLLERRGVENAVLGFDGIYRQGVYFLILRAHSNHEDALLKYRTAYTIGPKTDFGTLVAFELVPKPEAYIGERQDFSLKKPSDSSAPPRYTWREWFDRNQPVSDGTDGEDAIDSSADEETDER